MPQAQRPRRFNQHPRYERLERRALLDALPQGPELHVNTFTTNNQFNSAAAMDDAGNFVVVWQSVGQDGNSDGIYARRFAANGAPLGAEFRVNETTTGSQQTPTVAMDDDGDFVVAWNSISQGGAQGEIWARPFTNAGAPIGSEFHVNQATANQQILPSVAIDGAGNFVVAWTSGSATIAGAYDVYARRYNASGTAMDAERVINVYTTGTQASPSVAVDTDGDFIVAWQGPGDEDSAGIFARAFNQTGVGGTPFLVNQTTTNAQRSPAVAVDNLGNFVVAWESNLQDGSGYGVYARRFAAGGTPISTEFRVNAHTTDSQRLAAVGMDNSGDFTVVWSSRLQDGSLYGIYAQCYSAAGVPVGSEFRVNTYTTNTQFNPAVAMDADADFVVTWQSDFQEGAGASGGIYAKRFGPNVSPALGTFVWQNAPQRIEYVFNQNVAVDSSDIVLENLTTMTTIPAANMTVTPGTFTATVTFTGYPPINALPDGRYRATLLGSAVTPPLPADHVFEFFFLQGDANHDARVNLADFNILAGNFGQTGRDFTQGNFTYDAAGLVNLADFNLLAGRFGQTVAPAPGTAATGIGASTRRDDRDRMIGVVD